MSIYDWSTTASSNDTADANINWQENQNPSTVNNSARAMMAALKSGYLDLAGLALGGTGDAFTLTPAQAIASLTNAVVGFISNRANTGAVTLSVSGLTAKPLRLVSGTDLVANQILANCYYLCAYNTSSQEWLIVGYRTLVNADFATMTNNTVKANISGGAAVPSDVTIDNLINAASANSVALSKLPTQSDQTILANISGGAAVPAASTLSAILDDILGTTRGFMIVRGASGWTTLAVGTANQILKSDGTDPAWATTVLVPTVASKTRYILSNDGSSASWVGDRNVIAWAQLSDGNVTNPTINASYNITSVTRTSIGRYTVVMTNAAADANYVVSGSSWQATYGTNMNMGKDYGSTSTTTTLYISTSVPYVSNAVDFTNLDILVVGNVA